jgi:hypothetical protein
VWASERVADVNVSAVSLKVNTRGEALVVYRREDGRVRRVLVWGALDARHPSREVPQVRFRFDYAGGWGKYRREVWRRFRDRCTPYDGPRLVNLVAACKAPDGSYWTLQSWRRIQPLRGLPAFLPNHMDEVDTYNSMYGRGWKRDAAKVTHSGNGGFCFSFVPQRPPPEYPSDRIRGPGNGERHRVTVMGPGVTPVIQWEGPGLGRYDAAEDRVYNELFDRMLGRDRVCAPER